MSEQLIYRGRPLVRCGDEMYYGNMTEKYVIYMQILEKADDGETATKVLLRLQYTDPDIKGKGKIVKETTKNSLAEAFDFANAWIAKNK